MPRRGETSSRGSKDHKWLVHTSCLYLFGSEYDKRLVPTSWWYSFWSKDDKRLVSPAVDTPLGGLRYRQGGVRRAWITSDYCISDVRIRSG